MIIAGQSRVVTVESEDQFNSLLKKVQGKYISIHLNFATQCYSLVYVRRLMHIIMCVFTMSSRWIIAGYLLLYCRLVWAMWELLRLFAISFVLFRILMFFTKCNMSTSSSTGRFISPLIGELSEKYTNVTTYKIDIDQVSVFI